MKRFSMVLRAAVLVSSVAVGSAFAQISPKLLNPGEAPDGSPVAKYGWLKADGGNLRGSKSGTTNVQLKGMSFGWSNAGDDRPFYNENVVGWMAHDWQADVLRAPLGAKKDEGGGQPGYCETDAVGNERLVRVITEACIMRGLYVILDFHSHKAHEYKSCAQAFFKDMVAAYGKYPNVIYEIYNEPTGNDWNSYKSYHNDVISTIRSAESTAGVTNPGLIVVGTPSWSSQPNIAGDVTDSKNNVAYALHFYANTGAHDSYRGNATSAKSSGRTVFVTEFGTTAADGNGGINTSNTGTWISNTLNPNSMSWVNWKISNRDESSSILKSTVAGTVGGWTSANYSPSGTYIRGLFPASSNRTYTVTLTQPAAGGTISKEPAGNTHAYNSEIRLRATPEAGWELLSWTGDAAGSNEVISGNITGVNLKISAEFYNGGLVKNGHFSTGTASWSTNNSSSLALTVDNGQLKAAVSGGAGTAVADLRVTQGSIKLEKGHKYTLSFKARGQSARSVTTRITNATGTRDYIGNTPVSLTATMQTFTKEFVSDTTNATAVLRFDCGGEATTWFMDDVKILDNGGGHTAVAPRAAVTANRAAWSVVSAGGAATLRGPAEAGATLTLFDARGKTVRSLAAKDGLALNAGIPVGSYIAVIRDASGREVYRARVPVTR